MTTTPALDTCPAFVVNRDGATYRVAVVCSKCPARQVGTDKPNAPPEQIAKHFRQRYRWEVYLNGRSATCPDCQRAPAKAHHPKEKTVSKEAIVAQTRMIDLLREHVDSNGTLARYTPGWDDARIARECGLSVVAVGEAREAIRPGALVDPALEQLQVALAEERARRNAELSDIRQLLENAKAESDKRIADLERRCAILGRPRTK